MEIERKFIVADSSWRNNAGPGELYRQGYIINANGPNVRIRTKGKVGEITVKGPRVGISRLEFNYDIPFEDAEEMLENFCERPFITKFRYKVGYKGLIWEIDEFLGDNEGLILAEVELQSADQRVQIPPWAGIEVSDDRRFYNSFLVKNPYNTWGTNEKLRNLL